jgi:hypothetical protein
MGPESSSWRGAEMSPEEMMAEVIAELSAAGIDLQ